MSNNARYGDEIKPRNRTITAAQHLSGMLMVISKMKVVYSVLSPELVNNAKASGLIEIDGKIAHLTVLGKQAIKALKKEGKFTFTHTTKASPNYRS